MARDFYDAFDEVYCISDLHLSDKAGADATAAQMLVDLLGGLVERAKAGGPKRCALVINGDTVDFLDVAHAQTFDRLGAPYKLADVFAANHAVWAGLDAFSKVGTVILALGNHDVELALPTCSAMLRNRITGKLILAFDGSGYRCRVGETQALYLHGNNADPWNVVDYELLARIRAAMNSGLEPEPWDPNEGTKLVIEVINRGIKQSKPIFEYLKPEGPWLLKLIAQLGLQSQIAQYAQIAPRRIAAQARYIALRNSPRRVYLDERDVGQAATLFSADDLVIAAQTRSQSEGAHSGFLGRPSDDEVIRNTLREGLGAGRCFQFDAADDLYPTLRERIGPELHWVVCGHTHLRRSIVDGHVRHYFNSGTWMRLLDLEGALETDFPAVKAAFAASNRGELDACRWGAAQPIVRHQPTVVMLQATSKGAKGWLADASALDEPLRGFDEHKNEVRAEREIQP